MEDYLIMPSDCSQDRFVVDTLNQHKNGFWVELGCQGPIQSSNTHILEVDHGWRGLSIDISQPHIDLWEGVRNTEHLVCADAITLDYSLSLDLEPPSITLEALYKLPFDKYKFRVITFEHDEYRGTGTKEPSREFLLSLGYSLVDPATVNSFHINLSNAEDWYLLNV